MSSRLEVDDRTRLLQLRLSGHLGRQTTTAALGSPTPDNREPAEARPQSLTAAQRRMLLVDELSGTSLAYNVAAIYQITGPVQHQLLQQAMQQVIARHDILRLRLDGRGGQVSSYITSATSTLTEYQDLSAAPDPTNAAQLIGMQRVEQKFDLHTEGPFRSWLLRTAADQLVLGIAVHHMVFDRQSLVTWASELAHFYRRLTAPAGALPELPRPQQVSALPTEPDARERAVDLTFWQHELSGVPSTLDLPVDRPRPVAPTYAADEVLFKLSEQVSNQVRSLAAACATTPFTVLLSAYSTVLASYAGQAAVSIGCPFNGRPPGFDDCIGFFANSLPVVVRPGQAGTVRELIATTRAAMLDAQDHQRIPFDELVRALAPPRRPGVNPLFQVWFDLSEAQGSEASATVQLPDCTVDYFEAPRVRTRFDLELHLTHESSGRFAGRIIYAKDLFEPDTVELLSEHLSLFVQNATADPERPLADIKLEPID